MKLLSGFTVSELSSDFTANDMKTASVSATDMKTAFDAGSYTISQITTGGYLLGGGFQASGTTQRLGFGSFNVLQYTMVNADGNIMKISELFATTFWILFRRP